MVTSSGGVCAALMAVAENVMAISKKRANDFEVEPEQPRVRRRSGTSIKRPIVSSDAPTAADARAAQGARSEVELPEDALQPEVDQSLKPGSLVGGRYLIEEHISSGGFGAVYRAADREIRHHQVALKVLHQKSTSDKDKQAALRELRLLATVTHPSVVQFKEYGWHDERLWFAMPWYTGRTLDQLIGDGPTARGLRREEARRLFTRLAHGLAAMHAVGVHHHDIKPENIFVAQIDGFDGGLPVLLDLGIATQRGENPVGLTVEYASPETAAAMLGHPTYPIGPGADVYSLALVLRNMLDPSLARPPRSTSQVADMLRARVERNAQRSNNRDLRYLRPHFKRWLSQDPDKRPTASELAQEFEILTAPEDRRQARWRFLQRALPVLAILGLVITALTFQLQEKKSALVVKGRELEQEREVKEALKRQSEEQLDRLDISARRLGLERRQVKQARAEGRRLSGQLTIANQRFDALTVQHQTLTAERDGLRQSQQELQTAHDDLAEQRDTLNEDLKTVRGERDQIVEQRDEFRRQRDETERARDKAIAQRDSVTAQRDEAATDRDETRRELKVARTDLKKATNRVSLLDKRIETLRQERDAVRKVRDKTKRELATERKKSNRLTRQRKASQTEAKSLRRRLATAKKEQGRLRRKVQQLQARARRAPKRRAAGSARKRRARR